MRNLQRLHDRLAKTSEAYQRCTVPGCGRPTMLASSKGLAAFLCRYHVQYRARHGSAWTPTYKAAELAPYLNAASILLKSQGSDPLVAFTVAALRGVMDASGRAEPAMALKRQPAAYRCRVAFARLRDAGVPAVRLLATHLAVSALIEDDGDAHRVEEFRLVQIAKAVHRLASGTHRRWDWPLSDGRTAPLVLNIYPKSSGLVLRYIGKAIDDICASLTARERDAVRRLREQRYGLHPSRLPGWIPRWQRVRNAKMARVFTDD